MDSTLPSGTVTIVRAPARPRSLSGALRKAAIMAVGLACLGLAFVILLPLALLGLLVVLVVVGASLVGSAFSRRALPEDDGRRNVRVREPSADHPGA